MSGPRLTSIDLWGRHERRCLQILREALAMLATYDDGDREVDLNRRLYRCIVAASHAIAQREQVELPVVVPEGRNPPSASDAERSTREHKIPDFYWAYIDHLADNPVAAARQFVVECKRLTVPSKNWVYTEQYIKAGVVRFTSSDHGYGKAAPSGAMVGYLQEVMQLDQALLEVNAVATAEGLPTLTPRGDPAKIAELDHSLVRAFPDSPYHLLHLWLRP